MVKSYIGSLHTPEVIEKFRKLGASQEVLLVLQQGLFMPYEESLIPKNEFFTHNKTYFENREFANQQLKIWELKGQLYKRYFKIYLCGELIRISFVQLTF